jgi:dolichol-phosphate mannosyltransferase
MSLPMDALAPSGPQPARHPAGAAPPAPELGIVVPAFRAAGTMRAFVEQLGASLDGIDWELMVVDDNSPDDTSSIVEAIGADDPRVRAIRRVGRNGLAQTCVVAMLASRARHVAMMDLDVVRDHALPRAMLERLHRGDVDVVVASRERGGGHWLRSAVRKLLIAVTRRSLATGIGDPTSDVFMMRREALAALTPSLSSLGYQILLDLIATAHGRLRIAELPRDPGATEHRSELKLTLELLALILAKVTGDAVSIRFLLFCLVGLSGLGVHLAALDAALLATLPFTLAQTFATVVAMIWNFSLNNAVTYGDQRLTGWSYLTGLIRFMIICGIGAISNVGVASWIYANDNTWWIAGLGGALMGAVWNYAVSSVFVWRMR